MQGPVPPEVISRLKDVLGSSGWSQDPDQLDPLLHEWRRRWRGATPLMVQPDSTAQVAAVVSICAAHGVAITPQGGNTGLVGGQIPQGEILLSTRRLNRVREVARLDECVVVEAGVTLAETQAAAIKENRLFPLSLAAESAATIGGVLSTNAGGTAVLRYGVARDLVLGIEAVLPDGRVFEGLKRLRKDNTGYDLKQLLIGAEGTLGIITAASLKLYPQPRSRAVAIVGLASADKTLELLQRAREETGGAVEAFELMGRQGLELVLRNIPDTRAPFAKLFPWQVLIELTSPQREAASPLMEQVLARAFEDELITDAAIAQNEQQAYAFWRLREDHSAAQRFEGVEWKHDVSVPISQIPAFLSAADAAILGLSSGARIVAFGHVGDGNIHYNVVQPAGEDGSAFEALRERAAHTVHNIVHQFGGSISAEHGLGIMKTAEALRFKSAAEVDAMRAVRAALDPARLMNPRVLF